MSERKVTKQHGFKPPSARRRCDCNANTGDSLTCENSFSEFLTNEELQLVSKMKGYVDLDPHRCDLLVQELLDYYEASRFHDMEKILACLAQTRVNPKSLLGIGGSQLGMTIVSISKLHAQGDQSLYVRLANFLIWSWDQWICSAINSQLSVRAEPGSPPASPTMRARAR